MRFSTLLGALACAALLAVTNSCGSASSTGAPTVPSSDGARVQWQHVALGMNSGSDIIFACDESVVDESDEHPSGLICQTQVTATVTFEVVPSGTFPMRDVVLEGTWDRAAMTLADAQLVAERKGSVDVECAGPASSPQVRDEVNSELSAAVLPDTIWSSVGTDSGGLAVTFWSLSSETVASVCDIADGRIGVKFDALMVPV